MKGWLVGLADRRTYACKRAGQGDFMFWPWEGRKIGWYMEPGYSFNFGHGHEQSISMSIGLLIPIP